MDIHYCSLEQVNQKYIPTQTQVLYLSAPQVCFALDCPLQDHVVPTGVH